MPEQPAPDFVYEEEVLSVCALSEAGATSSEIAAYLSEEAGLPLRGAKAVLARALHVEMEEAMAIVLQSPEWEAIVHRNRELWRKIAQADSSQDTIALLLDAASESGARGFIGATDAQIVACETRLGISFPGELQRWLRLCNGSRAEPGGFCGVAVALDLPDLEAVLAIHPQWLAQQWIPVAADGIGNQYVVIASSSTSQGHSVLFIDHEQGYRPAYVAASNLWSFLRLLLMNELEMLDWQWPFDRAETLREDPALAECRIAPLPWEA